MTASKLKNSTRSAAGTRPRKATVVVAREPLSRYRVGKDAPAVKPQVTTIRLADDVQEGLRLLEAHSGVKRPLNKWVNLALAEFIARQTASIADELEQALRNINAYRKADPGYKRAIKAFIDSEVAFAAEDPMEGAREPQPIGPAVSMVRDMLRG